MTQYSAINVKAVITGWLILLLTTELAVEARAQSGEAVVPNCVTSANWSSDPIPGQDLWASGGPGGVYVAVRTNSGNSALLSLSALDTLVIESLELFDANGALISTKEYLDVPAGTTFDLDRGTAATDATADVKWNTGPKSLEPVNDAMVYSCR